MRRLITLLLLFSSILPAQCVLRFALTTSGRQIFDNRKAGCSGWTLTFTQVGVSASVSLQSAPAIQGPWSTFTGTAASSSVSGSILAVGAPAYVSVSRTPTGTGVVSGTLVGCSNCTQGAGASQADWNAENGPSKILNKPALAPVALDGDYSSLLNKPSIPDISTLELLANKSTDSALGTSDTLYPTQRAVKLYVDAFTASLNTVSFSATPVFDLSLGNLQKIVLTGNVTSSSVTNGTAGKVYTFLICQNPTGGWQFAWPSGVKAGMTIGPTLSRCSSQMFVATDATTLYAVTAGVTNQ